MGVFILFLSHYLAFDTSQDIDGRIASAHNFLLLADQSVLVQEGANIHRMSVSREKLSNAKKIYLQLVDVKKRIGHAVTTKGAELANPFVAKGDAARSQWTAAIGAFDPHSVVLFAELSDTINPYSSTSKNRHAVSFVNLGPKQGKVQNTFDLLDVPISRDFSAGGHLVNGVLEIAGFSASDGRATPFRYRMTKRGSLTKLQDSLLKALEKAYPQRGLIYNGNKIAFDFTHQKVAYYGTERVGEWTMKSGEWTEIPTPKGTTWTSATYVNGNLVFSCHSETYKRVPEGYHGSFVWSSAKAEVKPLANFFVMGSNSEGTKLLTWTPNGPFKVIDLPSGETWIDNLERKVSLSGGKVMVGGSDLLTSPAVLTLLGLAAVEANEKFLAHEGKISGAKECLLLNEESVLISEDVFHQTVSSDRVNVGKREKISFSVRKGKTIFGSSLTTSQAGYLKSRPGKLLADSFGGHVFGALSSEEWVAYGQMGDERGPAAPGAKSYHALSIVRVNKRGAESPNTFALIDIPSYEQFHGSGQLINGSLEVLGFTNTKEHPPVPYRFRLSRSGKATKVKDVLIEALTKSPPMELQGNVFARITFDLPRKKVAYFGASYIQEWTMATRKWTELPLPKDTMWTYATYVNGNLALSCHGGNWYRGADGFLGSYIWNSKKQKLERLGNFYVMGSNSERTKLVTWTNGGPFKVMTLPPQK